MDITEIISCVLALATAVILVVLMPQFKKLFSDDARKRITEYIRVGVMAAEQLFPERNMGKEKLQYVADYLKTKGITFNVNDIYDEIRMMIESAVQEFTK